MARGGPRARRGGGVRGVGVGAAGGLGVGSVLALLRRRAVMGVPTGEEVLAAVPRGAGILVAVSGGADSTALALALHAAGRRVVIAHVHHHLRPHTAWRDAAFVEALAGEMGVLFCRLDIEPAVVAGETGESVEMAARRLRRDALKGAARERGIRFIATGHQADDQAETLLLRICKGTSVHGLRGIPARWREGAGGVWWIRPLLGVRRGEIEAALRACGRGWRTDPTNAEDGALRNRIRHEVFPLIERRINPSVRVALLRLAEIAAVDDDCLEGMAGAGGGVGWGHPAIQRRVVQRGCMGRATHGQIVVAAGEGAAGGVGVGEAAVKAAGLLWPWRMRRMPRGDPFREALGFSREGGEVVCLSAAAVGGRRIRLRRWRAGDRMKPLGMTGHKKLSDIFTDLKMPGVARRQCVVVDVGGEIAALAGWRVAADFAVGGEGERAWWWRR